MRSDRFYPFVLIAWFFAAVAIGESGRLAMLEPPAPQVVIAVLTAVLLVNGVLLPGFRGWLARLDLRRLIAVHLGRWVGAWLLVRLPYDFAVIGGIGDVVIALGATVLLIAPGLAARPAVVLAWNALGFAEIVLVVATAAGLGLADPSSMRMLLVMPLVLLPTFLVPLVVATHVWIFWRLARGDLR